MLPDRSVSRLSRAPPVPRASRSPAPHCLPHPSEPAGLPTRRRRNRQGRRGSPARRGAPPARPRSRLPGHPAHRRQSGPARTLAMRIIRLAVARSPWWFCPISAMIKHGCSPPTRRPGHSSNSRDMMAASTPPARNCASAPQPRRRHRLGL